MFNDREHLNMDLDIFYIAHLNLDIDLVNCNKCPSSFIVTKPWAIHLSLSLRTTGVEEVGAGDGGEVGEGPGEAAAGQGGDIPFTSVVGT